jgi:hypothetical protein
LRLERLRLVRLGILLLERILDLLPHLRDQTGTSARCKTHPLRLILVRLVVLQSLLVDLELLDPLLPQGFDVV